MEIVASETQAYRALPNSITHILLDFDGPISNLPELLNRSLRPVCKKIPENSYTVYQYVHGQIDRLPAKYHADPFFVFSQILSHIGIDASSEELKEVLTAFTKAIADPPCYRDAFHLLTICMGRFKIYLTSSIKAKERAKKLEEDLGVQGIFAGAFDEDMIGFPKNDARFWREVLRNLGVSPENCLVIGDSPTDDGKSTEVGMYFMLVDRQCLFHGKMEQSFHVHNLDEALLLLIDCTLNKIIGAPTKKEDISVAALHGAGEELESMVGGIQE